MIYFIISPVIGYLIGSIPIGMLLVRRTSGVNLLEYGSGRIGFANVLRTAGTKIAAISLIGDLLKGASVALIARYMTGSHTYAIGSIEMDYHSVQVLAAICTIVGHNWSIYIKFRGGKGVDAYWGGLAVMYWPAALIGGLIINIGVMVTTRYISVGSLIGTLFSVIFMIVLFFMNLQPLEYVIYALVGSSIILAMHIENIQRLLAGTERRIGQKAERLEG